ncbi:MAG: hypothetical protein RLZZ196_1675 [Bacteroidota bacterium]|jgi:hypothetical protein
MITEHIRDEKYKIVRFYIDYLPFEILTEIENDPIVISEMRMAELEKDFEKYGDYLHSHLYTENIKEEKIEE